MDCTLEEHQAAVCMVPSPQPALEGEDCSGVVGKPRHLTQITGFPREKVLGAR